MLDGDRIRVPMMKGKDARFYVIGEGYQAVQLEYVGYNTTSMVIVMPDEGQFGSFERSLDVQRIRALLGEMQFEQVILTMPTFEFDSQSSLSSTLSSMGMPLAFSTEADFSGIIGEQPLWIDDVLHKAWVSVDEKGTEAAAATGTLLRAPSLDPPKPPKPVEITIDHPFIFFIRDTATGTILFVGRVVDPSL